MSYGGFPVGPFLGPYAPPGNLSRGALSSPDLLPPGSFGDILADKGIVADAVKGVLKDLFVPGREGFSGWTSAIAEAFMDPYGLGLQNSSITALGTRGNVSQRIAAAYPGVPLYAACATPDRPFPIILGSIMRAETDQVFYPFEATPLYVGAPARNTSVDPPLGSGFVEPIGFNSPPPDKPPAPGAPPVGLQGAVNVTPSKLVPLSTYLGISSSFIAQGVRPDSSALYALTGTERLQYWDPVNYTGGQLSFADGAGVDNLAVTPLLRRHVTHIVVCVAGLNSADVTAADWAVAQYDVAGLFGAVPLNLTSYKGMEKGITGVRPDVFNKALQVFPEEGYMELYASLAGGLAQGQPAIHRASYPVLDNPAQAVIGGWQVEVLWIVNMQVAEWEERLPNDTRSFLNSSRDDKDSDLRHYPYISTWIANYSPELVTLLSQQATWTVLQAAAELSDMLETATAATNATASHNAAQPPANATSAAGAGGGGAVGGPGTNATAAAGAAAGNATAANSSAAVAAFPPAAAALAALRQLDQAPRQIQLAGMWPQATRAVDAGYNISGGLSEAARQPQNSYVMVQPRPPGGPPAVVITPGTAAPAAAVPATRDGGAGRGAGGRQCWWQGLLTVAVVLLWWPV